MFFRNHKGLTLIELIVVMAIMVILATVSFVSIQYAVGKNAYKAYGAKCEQAMDLCKTNAQMINKGVGYLEVDGVTTTYIAWGATINTTNFRNMIASRIKSAYDIQIRAYSSYTSYNASSKDIIVVYITGLNTTFNVNTNLVVKGAWFYKKGTYTSPAATYYNGTLYEGAKSIP